MIEFVVSYKHRVVICHDIYCSDNLIKFHISNNPEPLVLVICETRKQAMEIMEKVKSAVKLHFDKLAPGCWNQPIYLNLE